MKTIHSVAFVTILGISANTLAAEVKPTTVKPTTVKSTIVEVNTRKLSPSKNTQHKNLPSASVDAAPTFQSRVVIDQDNRKVHQCDQVITPHVHHKGE